MLPLPLYLDPSRSPSRYDVELSETAFCCGGLLKPCNTPGCTECGTHYQPLELASHGAGKPWCIPSHARCVGNKERVTCEVCRRRLGLTPLPTCTRRSPYMDCELPFHDVYLRMVESVGLWNETYAGREPTTTLIVRGDGSEARAHQDGTVEVFRVGQLIARGRWGKKGLGRVEGVVSGIEPCHPELLIDLEHLIQIDGNGPLENDIHTCPRCGQGMVEVVVVYDGLLQPKHICEDGC